MALEMTTVNITAAYGAGRGSFMDKYCTHVLPRAIKPSDDGQTNIYSLPPHLEVPYWKFRVKNYLNSSLSILISINYQIFERTFILNSYLANAYGTKNLHISIQLFTAGKIWMEVCNFLVPYGFAK